MIVAVFSDVHANALALDAFLAEVDAYADAYLCLGDSVNYGPWNDECLERILGLPNITMLEGNHERLFRGDDDLTEEIPLVRAFFEASRASFRRSDLIDALPASVELGSFLCVHTIDGRRIYADTEVEVARDHLIGHSHHQFLVTRDGYTIVNPGSVGQNRKRIDRVDYALYDTEGATFSFASVPYDVTRFIAELQARAYPRICIEYYEGKLAQARAGGPS
jgi:predicted phosphodiesterase